MNNSSSSTQSVKLSYLLFLHGEMLRQRIGPVGPGPIDRCIRLTKTKLWVTEKLIEQTVELAGRCSNEDLSTLGQQIIFKKQLKGRMLRLQKWRRIAVQRLKSKSEAME